VAVDLANELVRGPRQVVARHVLVDDRRNDLIHANTLNAALAAERENTRVLVVVNELLVQMQSFDMPTGKDKLKTKFIDGINVFLPQERALPRPKPTPANILIVAATNRAADLDPALLRPGRFDRVIHFDLPPRADRVEIAKYYLRDSRRVWCGAHRCSSA
jgi:SpoVK/Ycf46/Vps4 family AAA+-type ATPase